MPQIFEKIFPVILSIISAYLAYMLGQIIYERLFRPKPVSRVKKMTGIRKEQKVKPTDFGSEEFKIRLAFQGLHIDVTGFEYLAVNIARIVAGSLFVFALYFILGLPPIASMVGFLGGLLIVNSMAGGAWRKLTTDITKEIPLFLSGFTSTIQVSPNVLQAVEEEASVLQKGSHLQWWLINRFVRNAQEQGISAIDGLVDEAFRVSTSLGAMIFLIGRMWRTGGVEWQRAFTLAAANLEGVMDARILGLAAGSAAKNSVKIIIAVTIVVILTLSRNPIFQEAMKNITVQMVYAFATLFMVFGYGVMGDMIDNLL